MPNVRTASELQRNMNAIYNLCESTKEPVYITRNGKESLVVMDAQAFDDAFDLQRRVLEHEMRVHDALIRSQGEVERGELVDFADIRQEA